MKHPFKILGAAMIIGVAIYGAWPTEEVRNHNPLTGEGAHHHDHDHEHLDEPTFEEVKESLDNFGAPEATNE